MYGSTTVGINSASDVGAGCGVGRDAKLENSAEICRSSLTCDRIDVTHSSSTGVSGSPLSLLTRTRCSDDN